MNRSILIVICDFIVLSMLSLTSGVSTSPADSNYGMVARLDERAATRLILKLKAKSKMLDAKEKELLDARKKAGALAGVDEQLKKVRAELENTRARLMTLDKTADLKGSETSRLSKELEEEAKKHAEARTKLESALDELAAVKGKFKSASDELVETKAQLNSSAERLKEKNRELELKEKDVLLAAERLNTAKTILDMTRQDLESKKNELALSGKELQAVRVFAKESQMNLSYAKGKLSATENELKEARSLLDNMRNKLFTNNVELAGTRKQLDTVKSVLDKAVVDLSKTKGELVETKGALTQTTQKLAIVKSDLKITENSLSEARGTIKTTGSMLEQTKTRLKDVEDKLLSDALKKYSQAVVELSFSINEGRLLLGDYKDSTTWFLPEVVIDGKTYLVSYFNSLTGSDKISGHAKITELKYAVKSTDKNKPDVHPVPGPVMALSEDPRVCLVPVASIAEKLNVISFTGLKKRGIQDIYLFKSDAFGRKSGKLDGRCSLSLSPDNNYLFIRNSTRTTDEIIKAEPGDFVITKQGEFIGVVVAVETTDFGRRQEAKCFVFPDRLELGNATMLSLRKGKDRYYDDFATAAEELRRRIRNMD